MGDSSSSVASHYNKVKETSLAERTESKIFHLRNFNNWLKSELIQDACSEARRAGLEIHALDLSCGKGGDLRKWDISGAKTLVMSDIAEVSLDQAKGRYQQMRSRFKATFYPADFGVDRLDDVLPKETRFSVVSCQFAVHYAFSSEAAARRLAQNIADRLLPGGVFIGTTTDSNLIVSLLRSSAGHELVNPLSAVRMVEGQDPLGQLPLFGGSYHFHLDSQVNVPEFLLHFPTFVRLLEEQGLELVFRRSFADFAGHKMRNEKSLGLLKKMKGLEAYPPGEKEDKSEYEAAEAKLAALRAADPELPEDAKVGTMSRSEWQVTSLYIAFMFRRPKN